MEKYHSDTHSITRVFENVPLVWGNGKELCFVAQIKSGAFADGYRSESYTFSISGYNTLEYFLNKYGEKICDGAYVVDMRHCTIEQAYASCEGPILKCDQDPGINRDYYISLDLYVQKLRALNAKVGRFINGQVVWQ